MLEFIAANIWTLVLVFLITSVAFMALIFFGVPRIVNSLPENFFVDDAVENEKKNLFIYGVRNLLGLTLVIAGPVVMLPFITLPPGSGLLVMVVGIGLMDFPGKRKVLRYSLRSSRVRRLLHWMRKRAGKTPFHLPNELRDRSGRQDFTHKNDSNEPSQ